MTHDLPQRFWEKISQSGDCWEWTGARDGKGYARFGWEGKNRKAHRVAYEVLVGPIPDGLQLDHVCRNRACVNPDHLEPVTGLENVRRGWWGGRTHCKRGHPYEGQNIKIHLSDGGRRCRQCATENDRARRQMVSA